MRTNKILPRLTAAALCLVLLLGLMVFVLYNDIVRIVTR